MEHPTTQTSTSPRTLGNEDLRKTPPANLSAWEAFTFGFKGPGIVGLLLGLVMMLIPIVGIITLNGWLADTSRRIVRGDHPSVKPFDFNLLGDYLKAGLVVFIPQFALSIALGAVYMVLMFATSILGAIAVSVSEVLGIVISLGSMLMMFPLLFIFVFLMHAVQIRAELTGNLNAAFDLKAVWALVKRQWGVMFVQSLILGLLAIPAMFLGVLALVIGMYVVMVALQFAGAHLRAQIYVHDVACGGEVLQVFDGPGANI